MIKLDKLHGRSILRHLLSILATVLTLLGQPAAMQAQRTLNVTDFGAIGNAVQFWVNTTSNSVMVTTTNLIPDSAIGEAIELFGCGTVTTPPYCQDMVATITNVVGGTNIYVSQIPKATLTNTFATYGYNNAPAFESAIAAVGKDTNDTIIIPAGSYLFLTTSHSGTYGQSAIVLQRGGINFVGAGTNSTTLLSQGAWTIISSSVWRGMLVEVASPCTNNYPLTFSYLTMDGGVQVGNDPSHSRSFPASLTTGKGWDVTHDAFLTWCVSSASLSHIYFTNVLVQHWRGEEFKSIDQPANSTIGIYNCRFTDGNATALNVYESWDVRSNLFDNLLQVAEYYQAYYTYPSYFEYNYITNLSGNGFAINGGKGNNPPFIIQGNSFYFCGSYNGIETTPGDNVFITNNYLNGGVAISLGCAGYQGTFDNSNIVVVNNTFEKVYYMISISGSSDGTGANRVEDVQMYGNVLTNTTSKVTGINYYGWATNVICFSNGFNNAGSGNIVFSTGADGSQFALVDTNNLYYTTISDSVGTTNDISYANGSRFKIINPFHSGTVYALVDTNASQMPAGAQILIQNNNTSSASIPVYLDSALTSGPVMVPNGLSRAFQWTNGAWQLAAVPPSPPTDLHVITNSP